MNSISVEQLVLTTTILSASVSGLSAKGGEDLTLGDAGGASGSDEPNGLESPITAAVFAARAFFIIIECFQRFQGKIERTLSGSRTLTDQPRTLLGTDQSK